MGPKGTLNRRGVNKAARGSQTAREHTARPPIQKVAQGARFRAKQYVALRRHHAMLKGPGEAGVVPHYVQRVSALDAIETVQRRVEQESSYDKIRCVTMLFCVVPTTSCWCVMIVNSEGRNPKFDPTGL